MDPMQEILGLLKVIREDQLAARQTQLEAIKRQRAFVRFGAIFFAMLLIAYVAWVVFLMRH